MTAIIALNVVLISVVIVLAVSFIGVIMSIDALNNSIATLSTNVGLLIAQDANTVPQAQVDQAQLAVDAINQTVVAQLPPPTPAPAQ